MTSTHDTAATTRRHVRKATSALAAAAMTVAAMAAAGAAHAATASPTTYYNATTLPTTAEGGVVNYLSDITLGSGAGTYTLSSFNLGINFDTGTEDDYGVVVDFYTGVNTSSSASDALGNATDIAEVSGTLQSPGGSGNYTYTFTLNSPSTLTTADGTLGVQIQLTDAEFEYYSDDMNARFSPVAPTTGSAKSFVWNDANQDGTFEGSEQTTFGLGSAYTRLSLTGIAPTPAVSAAPEPAAWTLMIAGIGLTGLALRRRREDAILAV